MKTSIHRSALNQLFNEAGTYNEWSDKPVDERAVRDLYDLLKWGPTSLTRRSSRVPGYCQTSFCSVGYGKVGTPHPRNPRLTFEESGRFA